MPERPCKDTTTGRKKTSNFSPNHPSNLVPQKRTVAWPGLQASPRDRGGQSTVEQTLVQHLDVRCSHLLPAWHASACCLTGRHDMRWTRSGPVKLSQQATGIYDSRWCESEVKHEPYCLRCRMGHGSSGAVWADGDFLRRKIYCRRILKRCCLVGVSFWERRWEMCLSHLPFSRCKISFVLCLYNLLVKGTTDKALFCSHESV